MSVALVPLAAVEISTSSPRASAAMLRRLDEEEAKIGFSWEEHRRTWGGEVWWHESPESKRRPALILTRDEM